MEKASKALRRSGVRIKSIGSGYSDLQMVISQLKDVRIGSKAFAAAQSCAMQDLVKWSLKDENRAIQDALTQVDELFSVWAEVQREFAEHLKEFRHQFEMILEGARQLDVARTTLQTAELKETKVKKELKKAAKKATAEEIREMSSRLAEAEREKDIAQVEVVDRIREHEVVKLIRIKEGLFKMSEGYIDYGQKCDVIFNAQRDIALQIPDVTDRDIQDIKYTGSGATMQAVAKAKDKIKRFRRRTSTISCHGSGSHHHADDLPPPYSENPPVNPFYNQHVHDGGGSGGVGSIADTSGRGGGSYSECDSSNNLSLNISDPHQRQPQQRRGESPGDTRPLMVPPPPACGPYAPHYSPLAHPPLYPVSPGHTSPTYQESLTQFDSQDQFRHVTRRAPLMRRNSYFSDAEDVTEAISNINLSLDRGCH